MNRRQMLKCSASLLALPALPTNTTASPKVDPKWFTQKQLLHLFKQLDEQTTGPTTCKNINMNNVGNPEEEVYFAWMQIRNIMFRKTLDQQSKHWLVVNPQMCMKTPDIWHKHVFWDYSSPGKPGGYHIRRHWRTRIQEEITPRVYKLGLLHGVCGFYVCEGFPNNKIMMGMGHKKVVNFRIDGTIQQEWGECPNVIPYMDKPTRKNYAIITLDYKNNG